MSSNDNRCPGGEEGYPLCGRTSDGGFLSNGDVEAFIGTQSPEKDGHLLDDLGSVTDAENVKAERHQWGNKLEYILSMLGYCVGLGNVWRFPYICVRNGGGAFLIPFFLCLLTVGLPLYFLEVAVAQFLARSAYHIWAMSPMFRGVGLAMIVLIFISAWYYIMILAWIVIFLFNSFKSPLPWTRCDQPWNTNSCVPLQGLVATNVSSINGSDYGILANDSGVQPYVDPFFFGNDTRGYGNGSFGNASVVFGSSEDGLLKNVTRKSSSDEFWLNHVLNLSSGLEDIGGIEWHTAVSLAAVSFVVYLCLWRGVKSVGKVVYVTATLPYILITVLLIRGATLPGAKDGILFFITPDFSKLWRINTWIEACVQIFYSLGPSWGTLMTMASYNKFNNNCMKDAICLSLVCEGTSIYTGLATLSFLGHMAYKLSVPVETFASSGPGLAFVVYPEAISYLPLPQLWGVLFFTMLLSVGLDTQFVNAEVTLTFFSDLWPRFMRRWNMPVKSAILAFLFLTGLVFCTPGGMYIFQLADWYIGCFTVMVNAFIQCFVVAWVYGTARFSHDVELMIGRPPYKIFLIMWKFVTPVLLIILCGFTLAYYTAPTYEGYTYSTGANVVCWGIVMMSFALIPACAIYTLLREKGTFMQRLRLRVPLRNIGCPRTKLCTSNTRKTKGDIASLKAFPRHFGEYSVTPCSRNVSDRCNH